MQVLRLRIKRESCRFAKGNNRHNEAHRKQCPSEIKLDKSMWGSLFALP